MSGQYSFSSAARGRGYGRGRGNERIHGFPASISPDQGIPVPKSSQRLLARFNEERVDEMNASEEPLTIKEVEYVASYNWLDRSSPTILVPGTPPKWLPPGPKVTIKRDRGEYYRDPNGARCSDYPIEPAVRSVLHGNGDYNGDSVDIFACGSTFGCLLSVARLESRSFRFGVDLLGHTMYLARRTNTPTELIDNVYGYGHNFIETCTSYDAAAGGSVTHQRIIAYDFGGMKCLIRSETDAYLPAKVPSVDTPEESLGDEDSLPVARDMENHLRMGDLSVGYQTAGPGKLVVKTNTRLRLPIPQDAIVDIKTRSIKRMGDLEVDEFLPRLWVNQTPSLLLAFHEYGVFRKANIQIHDVRERVGRWEAAHQKELRRLKAMLIMLREKAEHDGGGRLEVRRVNSGPLELWTAPHGWTALTTKWRQQWTKTDGDDGDEDEQSSDDDSDGGVHDSELYLRF